MRKIILLILFLVHIFSLLAFFDFFENNPAVIAKRDYNEFYLPLLTTGFDLNNNLLQLDDAKIFQKNRLITEAEKKKMTKDDLRLTFNFRSDAYDYGKKNWNLKYSFILFVTSDVLEKDYAKLVLYGNEKEHYKTTNGQGSIGVGFSKISLTYGLKKSLKMSFIPEKLFSNKFLDTITGSLHQMPIYFGLRMNFYYPHLFGSVPLSEQEFGTSYLETYGEYKIRYYYTDKKSKGKFSAGFGLGLFSELPKGNFYLYFDDIMANLLLQNLQAEYIEGVYLDSLTHFEDGYEPLNESNSEEYRIESKTYKLPLVFETGYLHNFSETLSMALRFRKMIYASQNGLSVGLNYDTFKHIPFQFILGYEKTFYFQIKTGLKLNNFEYMVGTSFNYGMFRYAKGFGVQLGVKYKF